MENNNMDNLFEELLRESASLAVKELGEEIEPHPEIEFSKEHQDKMKRLFARERRKIRAKKFGIYASRIAAVLVVVIAVSGVAVFKVDALRVRFLNMFTDTQPTNTEVSFKDGTSYSVGNVTVGFVPEGFEVVDEEVTEYMSYLKFKHDEEYFTIDIDDSYSVISVDTEDTDTEKIDINGIEVLYSNKMNVKIFSYYVDHYAVNVAGNIENKLLTEIIKSLKIN